MICNLKMQSTDTKHDLHCMFYIQCTGNFYMQLFINQSINLPIISVIISELVLQKTFNLLFTFFSKSLYIFRIIFKVYSTQLALTSPEKVLL